MFISPYLLAVGAQVPASDLDMDAKIDALLPRPCEKAL